MAGKAGDLLDPGTGVRCFRIVYLDGIIVGSDAVTINIVGTIYYMKKENAPACCYELFSNKRAEMEGSIST